MSQWYYSKNNQQLGPLSPEQLKQLAASGQLQPSDLVWREGMSQRTEARKVKGLFPIESREKSPPSMEPTTAPIPPEQSVPSPQPSDDKPENWYYARGQQQFGPVTFQKLFELAASGELRPQDLVAREGARFCIAEQLLLAFDPQAQPQKITNADQWFFRTQSGLASPATFQQLATLALNGTLPPNNAIGRVGTNWVPAGAILTTFTQAAQNSAASNDDAMANAILISPLIGMATGFVISLFLGGFLGMILIGAVIGLVTSIYSASQGMLRYLPLRGGTLIVAVVTGSLLLLSCFGLVGDSIMSDSQVQNFLDNPSSYKGKTLTMQLAFEGEPLSGWIEHGVIAIDLSLPFHIIGQVEHRLYATIPAGMKVPPLAHGDFVRITFICKEGSSGSGNIITKLARK